MRLTLPAFIAAILASVLTGGLLLALDVVLLRWIATGALLP